MSPGHQCGPSAVITGSRSGASILATHLLNFFHLPALTFDPACLSPHLNPCHLVSSGCFCSIQRAGLCVFAWLGPTSVERCVLLAEFPLKYRCACQGLPLRAQVKSSLLPSTPLDLDAEPRLGRTPIPRIFLLLLFFTAIMGLLLKAKSHQCPGKINQRLVQPKIWSNLKFVFREIKIQKFTHIYN